MERDDVDYGALGRISRAVAKTVDDRVQEHERQYHRLPPPNRAPLEAIPFAEVTIPDAVLARMLERVRADGCDLEDLARIFDYPPEAIERHLAEYRPRWRRFLRERATG